MNIIKILLIEDNDKHLADAKNFFSTVENVDVTYAQTLVKAIAQYPKHSDGSGIGDYNNVNPISMDRLSQYDAIISDIHFPLRNDEHAAYTTYDKRSVDWTTVQPIGVGIAFMAHILNLPYVLVTDGSHHGNSNEWIYRMMNTLNESTNCGHRLVAGSDDTTGAKYWASAWEKIQKQLIKAGKL